MKKTENEPGGVLTKTVRGLTLQLIRSVKQSLPNPTTFSDFNIKEDLPLNYDLKEICKDIRCDILTCIGHLGVGHIGGCLSVVEALAVLYFKEMNIDPKNPQMAGRDRFICSKGHAGPAVYATLANRGYFDKKELLTLNQGGTNLPSHCDMNRTIGIDMTTGSLGQGFSCAVGVALGSKVEKDGATIYAMIGDGESQEGQIWEAAMFAAAKTSSPLPIIIRCRSTAPPPRSTISILCATSGPPSAGTSST